jgi:hypothetical protein
MVIRSAWITTLLLFSAPSAQVQADDYRPSSDVCGLLIVNMEMGDETQSRLSFWAGATPEEVSWVASAGALQCKTAASWGGAKGMLEYAMVFIANGTKFTLQLERWTSYLDGQVIIWNGLLACTEVMRRDRFPGCENVR